MISKDQFLSHPIIVVYDTEFTTWEGTWKRNWSGPNEHRELVQLAAQKVDLAERKVLDTFDMLARPTVNPELSDYFVELTGITQKQVNTEGVLFAELYAAFMTWAAGVGKYAYGPVREDLADAEVLEENLCLYNLPHTLPRTEFGNIGTLFRTAGIDTTGYNSGKLYQLFDLDLTGHEHNAMFDVTSLVQSLFAVLEQQKKLEKPSEVWYAGATLY